MASTRCLIYLQDPVLGSELTSASSRPPVSLPVSQDCITGAWTALLFSALPHPQAGLDERGAAAQETMKPEVNLSLCFTAAEKS